MRPSLDKGSDLPLVGAITLITILAGQNPSCSRETTPTINNTGAQHREHLAIREEAMQASKAQARLSLRNEFGEIKP